MPPMMSKKQRDILELAAHLPDLVLRASNNIREYPAVQHVESVVMFLDIWGFTFLCEHHTKLNLGVDILTKTLNDYLGHIENFILRNGGDVVEFAGDALLVVWDADAHGDGEAMARAVRCARQIQRKCHDWKTESGISLALKIALSAGPICVTYVGSTSCRHYCTSGPAVMDANRTEKQCSRGSIVLSPKAWEACPDRAGMRMEELPGGEMKLITVDKSWAEKELQSVRKESLVHNEQKPEREPRIRKIKLKTVHRSNMRPFIAPPVLRKLDENQSLDYLCEMREITVVFISLHMDAAHDHSTCLQDVYEKIHTSVSQFQGVINKIFEFDKGTSFLVLFGLPGFKHEHEACHAVQCAGQINDLVGAMIQVKRISIGVTTGKVFCGVVGHGERHEYTVIGPKVNMAARLMMHYSGLVTCDEETKRRSRNDSSGFVRATDIELKGIDDPGVVWEYTGAGNIDNSIPEYGHPLLEYVEEFEQCWKGLYRMSTTASSSSSASFPQFSRFVVLGGDPGVGKTRLLRAVINAATGMNVSVITCRPSLGQSSTPYHTICSVVLQLLDLHDVRSPQEREHRLQERFEDTELFWHLCLLNDLLGIQIPVTDEIADLSQRERTEALHAVLAYIVTETRNWDSAGLLIAIDDAHYVDADSWTYLEVLPSRHCTVALAMGSFRRNAEVPLAAARILQARSTTNIKLLGLKPQCMEPLLRQLLEMDDVPRELTITLTSHQPGRINPSWVKQCVYNMLHHGQLELNTEGERTECRVAKGVRLMELDIPPSLRGCMVAFIDRLPELQRTAVKIISVIGTSFNADVMSYLMPSVSLEKIHPTIGALQSAGILVYGRGGGPSSPVGGGGCGSRSGSASGRSSLATMAPKPAADAGSLRFQSITLQETAYALLLEKQRRKLHGRYATYLEDFYLGRQNGETSPKSTRKLFGKKFSIVKQDDNSNKLHGANGEQSLQSVYPQLVTHWRKANNMYKAVQYMVHGAESAVALGYNMQAISFIYQAKKLDPSPTQLKHLDALGAKATTSLLFTRRRRSCSPKGTKFKWRNMAAKARNIEHSTNVIEEENSEDAGDRATNGSGSSSLQKTENSSTANDSSNSIPEIRDQQFVNRDTPTTITTTLLRANPSSSADTSEPHMSAGIGLGHLGNGTQGTLTYSYTHSTSNVSSATSNGVLNSRAPTNGAHKPVITTYKISKFYLYAIITICIAIWFYVVTERAVTSPQNLGNT